MEVRFRLRSLDAVKAYLKTVPYGGLKVGFEAFTRYIIGNTSHGLRHDEPQRYVSRKAAGYKTSRAQMRYFFAVGILERTSGGGVKLNHYKRSGKTASAWIATPTNNGYGYTISNDQPGAYWTRDNDGQTRQHGMAGRRKVTAVIAANLQGAVRSMVAAVKKYLGQ